MTLIINGKTYEAGELIAYVENLEKENAELRNNGFTVSAMTEQQLKVALEKGKQLEKENVELKENNKVYCEGNGETLVVNVSFDSFTRINANHKMYYPHNNELEKENAELKDYNKKLLQSDIDKQNKIVLLSQKVNDLQKENAELDCQKNRNKACYSCANATERCFTNEIGCPCEKYKSYKDENEEPNEKLLEQKQYTEFKCNEAVKRKEVYEREHYLLIKAKEIIKTLSEFVNNEVEYDPEHPQKHTDLWNEFCENAKQFLKENRTYERIQKAKYNYTD